MGTSVIARLKQKLTTNDGELCHTTNIIVTNPMYDDSLIIKKRVLTERRDFYLNNGFKLLRVVGDKVLVEMIFSIKIETMATMTNWVRGIYEKVNVSPCSACDGWEESECCGALIKRGGICSDCGEHCDNKCENCEFKFE